MNDKIKFAPKALIVVAAVSLAYTAVAWLTGLIVQQELQRVEKQALEQIPYLTLVQRHYNRGVYSSVEEATYLPPHRDSNRGYATFEGRSNSDTAASRSCNGGIS